MNHNGTIGIMLVRIYFKLTDDLLDLIFWLLHLTVGDFMKFFNRNSLSLQSWIPSTLVPTRFDSLSFSHIARFFVRFPTEGTVASVKLISANKSPSKFYKVS